MRKSISYKINSEEYQSEGSIAITDDLCWEIDRHHMNVVLFVINSSPDSLCTIDFGDDSEGFNNLVKDLESLSSQG